MQYVIDIYEKAGETEKALDATRELIEELTLQQTRSNGGRSFGDRYFVVRRR